ncbi:dihydrodipicolinate synthase family protein [Patescibacteria group bacterium]|nr:dihydrodipicolinate synthase family protein [Patescibacteria group bacterium]
MVFYSCHKTKKKQVIQTATETAPAELNLLVGISSDTLKNTIELAKFAEESGAQALVLVPCFGGSQPPQKKIQAVLDATGNIPLILYLNPDLHREDQHLSPRDMASLISQHHRLTGAKISFGTMEEFTSYTVLQSDTFHVLQGNAYLVAESTQIPGFSLTGFIPIAANDQPKVHVDFHQKRTNLFRIIQQLPHEYPNIQTTIQKMLDNGRINQETFDIYQANLK